MKAFGEGCLWDTAELWELFSMLSSNIASSLSWAQKTGKTSQGTTSGAGEARPCFRRTVPRFVWVSLWDAVFHSPCCPGTAAPASLDPLTPCQHPRPCFLLAPRSPITEGEGCRTKGESERLFEDQYGCASSFLVSVVATSAKHRAQVNKCSRAVRLKPHTSSVVFEKAHT